MRDLLNKINHSAAGYDALPVRLTVGTIFIAHGAQKLFGAFGGYGLQATDGWIESIGLSQGWLVALLAGSAEFFGGLLLIIGFSVRPAAIALAFTMAIAIFAVHWQHGFFMSDNGYEFALALLGASITLVFRGAGSISIDNALSR